MLTAQLLADALDQSPASDFVRLVADWLQRVSRNPEVDLRAAPSWTTEPQRRTETLWYPGPDALLPHALVHTPLSFSLRGLLVEADSLESV